MSSKMRCFGKISVCSVSRTSEHNHMLCFGVMLYLRGHHESLSCTTQDLAFEFHACMTGNTAWGSVTNHSRRQLTCRIGTQPLIAANLAAIQRSKNKTLKTPFRDNITTYNKTKQRNLVARISHLPELERQAGVERPAVAPASSSLRISSRVLKQAVSSTICGASKLLRNPSSSFECPRHPIKTSTSYPTVLPSPR